MATKTRVRQMESHIQDFYRGPKMVSIFLFNTLKLHHNGLNRKHVTELEDHILMTNFYLCGGAVASLCMILFAITSIEYVTTFLI